MVLVKGLIDYDLLTQAIVSACATGQRKLILIDSSGNVVSDVPLSSLLPTRTSPTQEASAYSIPASDKLEIDKINIGKYSTLFITVRATYDASATSGVRVRWLYSPNGTNYDDEDNAENQNRYYDLAFQSGATKQATILIPVFADNIKVQIVNLDTGYPVTVDVWSWMSR